MTCAVHPDIDSVAFCGQCGRPLCRECKREVGGMIKPGTAVLFVLDEVGHMDAILRAIRGLGGQVLKTNVDLARAKLIQSTLAASAGLGASGGEESSLSSGMR